MKQETVVLREPSWKALEASGSLPVGAAAELASLHSLSSEQRSEFIEQVMRVSSGSLNAKQRECFRLCNERRDGEFAAFFVCGFSSAPLGCEALAVHPQDGS